MNELDQMQFTPFESWTLVALLAISIVYAVVLQWWEKHYPEGFSDHTWLQVVFGVAFTLAAQMMIMPLRPWLLACTTFIVSGSPIIFRSVYNLSKRRREANGGNDGDAS